MRRFRALIFRLAALFGKKQHERDFDAEMQSHLQLHIEDNLRSGMSLEEARRHALLKLGGLEQTKQLYRDRRSLPMLETLLQDIRFASRMLRKNLGFTLVAILTLALGIGANTAIFSVIEAVLLRPLPYNSANQLVRVVSTWDRRGVMTPYSSSPPDFFDWRDQNRSFSSMFAFHMGEYALTGRGEARRVHAVLATAQIFSTLRANPALGRQFLPEENHKGANHVIVLSHAFWQAEFGGMPNVIGQTIQLDSEPYTIIGVMPSEFRFPLQGSDALVPIGFDDKVMTQRGAHYLRVLGRLKNGVSLAQANEDLSAIMAQLRRLYPDKDGKWGVHADRWSAALVANIRSALLLLLGAVALVALIACANISNLLLARATVRHRELAMRRALGARPSRLVRQMLTEGLLLALLAGAAGLLFAHWALLSIVRFGPKDIPRLASVGLDAPVLWFAMGVSVLTAMLFGLLPALRSSMPDLGGLLKTSASSSREAGLVRAALIVGEVALSMMLLAGAGLLFRSFIGLSSLSPGFNPTGLLTMDVSVPDAHYKNSLSLQSYWHEALAQVSALPGVASVAAVTPLPLSGDDFSSSFSVEGRDIPEKDQPSAELRAATPDYFRTMVIPLLRGRTFTDADRLGSSGVLLISETAARMFFPRGDAIGQRLKFGAFGGYEKIEGEIVGVVGDVRHFGLDAPIAPTFYVPLDQVGDDGATLVIRVQGLPAALAQPARKLVQRIDRDALVAEPMPFDALVSGSLGQRRFYAILLGTFAGLALVLAAVGLHGVISYTVAQRTKEIGIRVAMGATRTQVLAIIIGHGVRFAAMGLAIGLVLALIVNRALKSLLVGVSTSDPLTLGLVAGLLALVALAACYAPARRATKVDPMVALRYE